jgi:hypothetical protein
MRLFLVTGTVVLSLATSAWADTVCQADDALIRALSPTRTEEYVHEQLSRGQYMCAARAVRIQAIFRSSMDGLAGWDSRFSLREMVHEISGDNSYSPQRKLELFEAAASPSLVPNTVPRRPEDLVADSRMLLNAAGSMDDCAARFGLLSLAARVNRKLPAGKRDREVRSLQLELCNSKGARGYRDVFGGIDALLILANDTQGDPEFSDWRGSLASDIDFFMAPDTVPQARQTLQLIDALGDVKECQNCGFNWRWRPAYRVALFYQRLQMPGESKSVMQQALGMIRGIPNPSDRLSAFAEVCVAMQTARYPDAEYLPVVNEMKPLAASVGATDLQRRLETNNCVPVGSWADRTRATPAP